MPTYTSYIFTDDDFCVALSPAGQAFPLELTMFLGDQRVEVTFQSKVGADKMLHMLGYVMSLDEREEGPAEQGLQTLASVVSGVEGATDDGGDGPGADAPIG